MCMRLLTKVWLDRACNKKFFRGFIMGEVSTNHDDSDPVGLAKAPLGKNSDYITQYDSTLLFPLPRQLKRDEIGVSKPLPFYGWDEWNAYEVSWLNSKGKPQVAIARFFIDSHSECIIESKSFKLYLNSFNQTRFETPEKVQSLLQQDIEKGVGGNVRCELLSVDEAVNLPLSIWQGECLDDLDIECSDYEVNTDYLNVADESVDNEVLYSHLLKSNCLVTGQPDWGSIRIKYSGQRIDKAGLLRYWVSFRQHNEFHEQCVERVFVDIMSRCKPDFLLVEARYTRRGGLDINPIRSSHSQIGSSELRLVRQ
jgi:7-cyano-7-deazaguanine reductase